MLNRKNLVGSLKKCHLPRCFERLKVSEIPTTRILIFSRGLSPMRFEWSVEADYSVFGYESP